MKNELRESTSPQKRGASAPFFLGYIPDSEAARRGKRAIDWNRQREEDIVPGDSDLYLGAEDIGPGDWGPRRDGGTLGCL